MAGPKILITGAAGRLGQVLTQHLTGRYELILTDIRQPKQLYNHPFIKADITNLDAVRPICQGIDIILHLAGNPDPAASWERLLPLNIIGTYNLFQAAYEAGCKRVVYASSVNTMLGYPPEIEIGTNMPVRPANLYGATKVWGEVVARLYADQKGLSCICLRLGGVRHHQDEYSFSNNSAMLDRMLTQRDLVNLCIASIEALDDLRFGIFNGISNNSRKRFDISDTQLVLNYEPKDDAFELAANVKTYKRWYFAFIQTLKQVKRRLIRLRR